MKPNLMSFKHLFRKQASNKSWSPPSWESEWCAWKRSPNHRVLWTLCLFNNLSAHFHSLILIDVGFFDVTAVDLSHHNLKRDEGSYYNKDENSGHPNLTIKIATIPRRPNGATKEVKSKMVLISRELSSFDRRLTILPIYWFFTVYCEILESFVKTRKIS